jgi:hypothetical protein
MKTYSMKLHDLNNTQDMEPKSIDTTFIIMKRKNLIQSGCRYGITLDGSKREYMSCYKMLLIRQNNPPRARYIMLEATRPLGSFL